MGKTPFSDDRAWTGIKHYCGYRERCHYEVREKLFGMGLAKSKVEELICRLIADGFLNEERFARAFAGGHFRQKKWGRIKIIHALRQKRVSEPIIKLAMKEIEAIDYAASLQKLAAAKWRLLKKETFVNRQAKTYSYLLQKGFEPMPVRQAIAALRMGNDA